MLDHVSILLAEDDPNDVVLMRRAFESAGVTNPLFIVHNGQEVIDFLQGAGLFTSREKYPLPSLLILDLKMPLMDGFDVLAWLREHPAFESLPVVVLTGSRLEEDISRSRTLGVFDYRVKPQRFGDLVKLLDDVRKCWLDENFNRFAPGQTSCGR
jgi:CheY-like chemotaxis protein